MKRLINILVLIIFVLSVNLAVIAAQSIDRLLNMQLNTAPLSLTPVVITFDHKVGNTDFLMLKSLGITGGRYLNQLPIILTSVNKTQFNALLAKPGIKSLYANHTLNSLTHRAAR
jgi:hypothetical protein